MTNFISPTNYNSCKSTKKSVDVKGLVNIVNMTSDLECNYQLCNPINKTFNAKINGKESQIVVHYSYRRVIHDSGLNFN